MLPILQNGRADSLYGSEYPVKQAIPGHWNRIAKRLLTVEFEFQEKRSLSD